MRPVARIARWKDCHLLGASWYVEYSDDQLRNIARRIIVYLTEIDQSQIVVTTPGQGPARNMKASHERNYGVDELAILFRESITKGGCVSFESPIGDFRFSHEKERPAGTTCMSLNLPEGVQFIRSCADAIGFTADQGVVAKFISEHVCE